MPSVLIVDDDSETVEVSTELLEASGYRVRTRNNGAEGLKCLEKRPLPDCILLDVDMPVLSGPAMAMKMAQHDRGEEKIPIVLVSARPDLKRIAGRIGTPYFLPKTSAHFGDALLALLARALRERRPP